MSEASPTLSIGLAVRNGRRSVERCIELILTQDFSDLELVVSDNASDDGTIKTLEDYARADRRLRLSVNQVNIGLHENMRRDSSLARHVLPVDQRRRLAGAEVPFHLRACTQEPPRCDRCHHVVHDLHARRVDQIRGVPGRVPELGGSRPTTRNACYGSSTLETRNTIQSTASIVEIVSCAPISSVPRERTDWLLSAELALLGPIIHVDKRLANRTREYPRVVDQAAVRRRL